MSHPVSFGTYVEEANSMPSQFTDDGKGNHTVVLFEDDGLPERKGKGATAEIAAKEAILLRNKDREGASRG